MSGIELASIRCMKKKIQLPRRSVQTILFSLILALQLGACGSNKVSVNDIGLTIPGDIAQALLIQPQNGQYKLFGIACLNSAGSSVAVHKLTSNSAVNIMTISGSNYTGTYTTSSCTASYAGNFNFGAQSLLGESNNAGEGSVTVNQTSESVNNSSCFIPLNFAPLNASQPAISVTSLSENFVPSSPWATDAMIRYDNSAFMMKTNITVVGQPTAECWLVHQKIN